MAEGFGFRLSGLRMSGCWNFWFGIPSFGLGLGHQVRAQSTGWRVERRRMITGFGLRVSAFRVSALWFRPQGFFGFQP